MVGKNALSRSRSAELTGGEGYTYEDTVAAYYLASLLRMDGAPGIDGAISRVAVQQQAQGEPMDDVIIDSILDGEVRRLSLQVKTSVTISDGRTNTDFREIIAGAKETRAKSGFRVGCDRYGFIARTIGTARFDSLSRIIEWARASDSGAHFAARFQPKAEANKTDILIRKQIGNLFAPTDVEDERDFFAHLVALRLEGLERNAVRYTELCDRLSDLTADPHRSGGALVSILCREIREGEGKAKVWTRPSLLADLRPLIKLNTSPAFAADLTKLRKTAIAACKEIKVDIGGIELKRSELVSQVEEVSRSYKLTNIRGLPGAGKSVILRRVVEAAAQDGPVLFLKSDRIEGASWISHATAIGLHITDPNELMAQMGASGTPTLFIDGIDRIAPDRRGVIIDLIHVIESDPAFQRWRIVATSRDQGLEAYRQWVPVSFYRSTGIGDVQVKGLDDVEALELAEANPNLKPLLFGTDGVKTIARRPFFASVLAKGLQNNDQEPPTTEVALIDAWWKAGGYKAEFDQVISRQRALLSCAEQGANTLGKSIPIRKLDTNVPTVLPGLIQDDVIRSVEDGVMISFAHDIYFEWVFFKLLIDAGDDWIDAIKVAGEAPLLGRIVALYSQRAFERGENWSETFSRIEQTALRPQWRRTWILGPTASLAFFENIADFERLLFADSFKWLERFLTWFQAECTIPNPVILNTPPTTLDAATLIRAADYLGWPSDISVWRRVLTWLHARVDHMPVSVLPSVVSLFSVWQNMLSDIANPISQKFLKSAQTWLDELQSDAPPEPVRESRWKDLDRDAYIPFVTNLRQLILRAARAYPDPARKIVETHTPGRRSGENRFKEIVGFGPILAETCPGALAEMTRRELSEALPQDKIDRERREREARYVRLKKIRDKSEKERTPEEQRSLLSGFSLLGSKEYTFDDIGIHQHHNAFFPSTPLDQPFAALLDKASDEGVKLVRDLTTHACNGWKQIHKINPARFGTPLPMVIDWPWGPQTFYGDHRTYAWYLGSLAPQPLQSAYLALTYWAHRAVDANRSVDDVIKEVVTGHQHWSILGLAISLALEKTWVSETVLSLLKAQRLWSVDLERQVQLPLQHFNIMGLDPSNRMSSAERQALEYLRERKFNKHSLQELVPLFALSENEELSKATHSALKSFPDDLPFAYEEEKSNPSREEYLIDQAKIRADWGDPSRYKVERVTERADTVAIKYEPTEPLPEKVQASMEESETALADFQVLQWAMKGLETGELDPNVDSTAALEHIKRRTPNIPLDEVAEAGEGAPQSALVATAALASRHFEPEADWAWEILDRVDHMKDELTTPYASPNRYHPKRFLIAALFSDLKKETSRADSRSRILLLATDGNTEVSRTALRLIGALHPSRSSIVCNGAFIATSLFSLPIDDYDDDGKQDRSRRIAHHDAIRKTALSFSEDVSKLDLVPPPPAWVFAEPQHRHDQRDEQTKFTWQRPDVEFDHTLAGAVLPHYPIEAWLLSERTRGTLTDYLLQLVTWTKERAFPDWQDDRNRSTTELYEWYRELAHLCIRTIPILSGSYVIENLLSIIMNRPDEDALNFSADVTTSATCRLVMDSPIIEDDALTVLSYCLDRLLQEDCFRRDGYRAGEVHGFAMPDIIRNLLFVSVSNAPNSNRFANGDWSDLGKVMPIIDRLMKEAGWSTFVINTYLTLCERAGADLKISDFTKHVSPHLVDGYSRVQAWRGSLIPSRLASVVENLADANYPLNEEDAGLLLEILDHLVDMGDRRAAALQQSAHFRGIQI